MRAPRATQGAELAAIGLLTAFALYEAVWVNRAPDFFIYRAGVKQGLLGHSPYDGAVGVLVAEQFPDDVLLQDQWGFFLPPEAVVVFAPFAAVSFPTAKVLWALLNGLSAAAVLLALRTFATRSLPLGGQLLLPLVLSWNYLSILVIELGQTSLFVAGCAAAGLRCFDRNRPALGVLLWSVAFVKPHLALPLAPLACFLGGWRWGAVLVVEVVFLNVLGAVLAGRSPVLLLEYLEHLGSAHKEVLFNRAGKNPEIVSWNRLLYAFTEPVAGDRFLIEQTASITLATYAVWFGLLAGRCCLSRSRPSPAWAAAAAGVGAVFCPQVLLYELLILVLAIPWVRSLFSNGYWVRGWAATALLVLELVPYDVLLPLGVVVHRPLGVALLAALVLTGPVRGSRVRIY